MQIITPEFVETGIGPDGALTDKQRELIGLVGSETLDDPIVAADIFGKEISDEAAAQFTLGRATEARPKPAKRERKKAEPKPEQKAEGELVERGGVKYSPLGLQIDHVMTFEEWDQLGDQIAIMHTASPWWIGDWYIAGEAAYGEAAAQARAISDRAAKHGHTLSPDTVIDYASLCRRFPAPERSENLSLSHYRIVRALPNASELLARAVAEDLSSRDLKRIVDGKEGAEPKEPELVVVAGEGEYDVIMADPPWQYSNNNVNGAAAKHYATMSDDDICAFLEAQPIKTGPNAALFLWVTNPFLEVGLRVMKAWGFEYKTNIAWVKETNKMGPGFYVRGAHELLFIGIKGKGMQPTAKNIKSVLIAAPMEHSKKPEEAYDIIEAMYPAAKKIEIFARHVRHKWDRIGHEAPPA
jgi:N6-adenosine-specific RNA methylase IME4